MLRWCQESQDGGLGLTEIVIEKAGRTVEERKICSCVSIRNVKTQHMSGMLQLDFL